MKQYFDHSNISIQSSPGAPRLHKTISTNRLVNSKHYTEIIRAYNENFADPSSKFKYRNGRINEGMFWKEFISPLVPDLNKQSWYAHIRRYKSAAGLKSIIMLPPDPSFQKVEETQNLENALLTNARATSDGIQAALNIGLEALKKLADPEYFSTLKDRDKIDLLFKAMRAQDSRINAIARIKQDSREEVKFQKAFDNAAYGGEEEINESAE